MFAFIFAFLGRIKVIKKLCIRILITNFHVLWFDIYAMLMYVYTILYAMLMYDYTILYTMVCTMVLYTV